MIDILPPEFYGAEEEQLQQMGNYLTDFYDAMERKFKNIDMSDLNSDLADMVNKCGKIIDVRKSKKVNDTARPYKLYTSDKDTVRKYWMGPYEPPDPQGLYNPVMFVQLELDDLLITYGVEKMEMTSGLISPTNLENHFALHPFLPIDSSHLEQMVQNGISPDSVIQGGHCVFEKNYLSSNVIEHLRYKYIGSIYYVYFFYIGQEGVYTGL